MSRDLAERVRALPWLDVDTGDGGGGRMVALDAVLDLLAESTPAAPDEEGLDAALRRIRDRALQRLNPAMPGSALEAVHNAFWLSITDVIDEERHALASQDKA